MPLEAGSCAWAAGSWGHGGTPGRPVGNKQWPRVHRLLVLWEAGGRGTRGCLSQQSLGVPGNVQQAALVRSTPMQHWEVGGPGLGKWGAPVVLLGRLGNQGREGHGALARSLRSTCWLLEASGLQGPLTPIPVSLQCCGPC